MKKSLLKILRNKKISNFSFRENTKKLADILAKELFDEIRKKNIVIISILRSGIALLYPFLKKFPKAKIGFLGIKRDEKSFLPIFYYENLPKIKKEDIIIILDPMIATGNTANFAIKKLIKKSKNIIFQSIISSKEGMGNIKKKYPKIIIKTVAIDEKLNSKKIIIPGLGDFGDRYFST